MRYGIYEVIDEYDFSHSISILFIYNVNSGLLAMNFSASAGW